MLRLLTAAVGTFETSDDVRSEDRFGGQKQTRYAHFEFFGS